jgi:hypothetical protein
MRGVFGLFLFFSGIVAILAALAFATGLVPIQQAGQGPRRDEPPGVVITIIMIVSALLTAGLVWFFTRLSRSRAMARLPQRSDQAVWGLAAFYTGDKVFSMKVLPRCYKAARAEWIKALVEANPDQVDDAVFAQTVGHPKPTTEQQQRPFA